VAAGLALADASVVVLALPPILTELHASVEAVAAVIGVYTLALAIGLPVAVRLLRSRAVAVVGGAGMGAFALASAVCGLVSSVAPLIAFRAVQGFAGAFVLVAAFALLRAGEDGWGRRAWIAVAVFGAAVGPALGGTLTELFDWRAIFLVQAPVVALAGAVVWGAGGRWAMRDEVARPAPAGGASVPGSLWAGGEASAIADPPVPAGVAAAPGVSAPLAAVGLVSAALTGVLFLLVLLLVSGWARSPLAAAGIVTVLPLAALAGTRIPGGDAQRAIAGCLLVAGGVGALGFLPGDEALMTIVPQLVAGLGMGMALPALAGGLLPERTGLDAARVLAARHVGVTLALAALAPLAAHQLDRAEHQVRERGTALILDARLPPLDKLDLANVATSDLDVVAPRAALRDALARAATKVSGADAAEFSRVRARADETLVSAVDDSFRPAFLLCAALALLAAVALVPWGGGVAGAAREGVPRGDRSSGGGARRWGLAGAAALVAIVLVPAQIALTASLRPEPVTIADPCEPRDLPSTGGFDGMLQDGALVLLDRLACSRGVSRETLALQLLENGSPSGILGTLLKEQSPADILKSVLGG